MFRIIVFEDKLGISIGYKPQWSRMLLSAGLIGVEYKFFYAKSYAHFPQVRLLKWKGNRKTPGFREEPDLQIKTLNWMKDIIQQTRANVVVLMDPALFFVVNNNWNQATTELLRGGVYTMKDHNRADILTLVMGPISSINRIMKPKDIAALNNGFAEKDEWDEVYGDEQKIIQDADSNEPESEDGEENEEDEDEGENVMQWYNPVQIPYGRFCFEHDLRKLGRILRAKKAATR